MNANRPRAVRVKLPSDNGRDHTTHTEPSILPQFIYSSLKLDVDSTRFVRVKPAESHDQPPCCELVEVAFRNRPRYEALSYKWGGRWPSRVIDIDGCSFKVDSNLYDAICFLRTRQPGKLYWIDALSVNQGDMAERNKQTQMMGQIYFRATSVVVWLGSKYVRHLDRLPTGKIGALDDNGGELEQSTEEEDETDAEDERQASELTLVQKGLVEQMCNDPYWHQVWTVPQIGKARNPRICFGNDEITWDSFFDLVTMYNLDRTEAARLEKLRSERSTHGYPLRKLLHDHQDALCQEPKDKVYGLVGLADDAHGFPLDYRKSLIQVWTDTMVFVNGRNLVSSDEIIPFGQLVKALLMGAECDPWALIARDHDGDDTEEHKLIEIDHSSEDSRVFEISSQAFGYLKYLGPSTTDMVEDLSKTREWGMSSQELYHDQLGAAHQESDLLLRAIFDGDEDEITQLCHKHVSSVVWNWGGNESAAIEDYLEANVKDDSSLALAPQTVNRDPAPRLYQCLSMSHSSDVSWKMGLVSNRARTGDMLCAVKGLSKAVVIRLNKCGTSYTMCVSGTAMIAENVARRPIVSDAGDHVSGEPVVLKMDARTIFVLIA